MRNKSISFINVMGLAIGITSALVISIFVRYELSFDRYDKKSARIYKVVQETKMADDTYYWNTTAYPLAEAIRNDFKQLPMVTQASGPVSRLFKVEDTQGNISRYQEEYVLYVDPYYPQMFDFKWLQGNSATALNHTNSVVLTEQLVNKYFGQESKQKKSILGRQILLNNKDALTVTGVIEDAPANTSLQYSMLIPYEFFRINNIYSTNNWSGNYQGSTFIEVAEGQSIKELEQQLLSWKRKYLKPEDDHRISYRLRALKDGHTDEKFGSAPQGYVMPSKMIYSAIGVAVFILIIACVNFINLSTAQAANRAREVGVRKVMGSSKWNLITQFLIENILLVGFATLISIAIAQFGILQINQLLSIIRLQLSFDWNIVAVVLGISCIVILLACFYPAVVMSSYRPVEALKNKIRFSSGLSLRRSLIVLQFAIVQIFIISTLVVAVQMNYFQNKDLGFTKEDPIIITSINELERSQPFSQMLLSNQSIKEVSFSSSSPLSDYGHNYGTSFRLPGQPEEEGKNAEEKGVDLNFLSFYNLRLLAGRNFSSIQPEFNEFIVNEKVVRALGWTPEQALGQRLIINEGEATIVGVIQDFHNKSLQEEITPCVLLNSSSWLDQANIKLQPNTNLPETLRFIESSWKQLYPEGIFGFSFLDDALAKKYALEQLIFKGFTIFSVLTVIIGCLGLYGLLSFMTVRKTKEVGIRKVLGASVTQIVTLFSKEFMVLIAVAFIVASPLCYYAMNRWLSGFAYRIDLSWWMFGFGILITIMIAGVTVSYQSIKAALVNPVESLKNE